MNVPIALLADYANITLEGKVNVMGIFDQIWSEKFPAVHLGAFVVLRFSSSPAERGQTKKMQVVLLDEDGQEINSIEGTLTVPLDAPLLQSTFNEIIHIRAMWFPHPGRYTFHVLINDDVKAEIPFTVSKIESTPQVER